MNSQDVSHNGSRLPEMVEKRLAVIGRRFAERSRQRLKETFKAVCEADTRSDLKRAGVLHSGHFAFRRGYHTDRFFAFGELSRSPIGSEITELLAYRIHSLVGDEDFSIIVTHGFEMSKVATELVRLSKREDPVHQLHATGTEQINFMGARRELTGERVLLLLNVINTGALLEELVRRLSEEGAILVRIVSVVDLGNYKGAFKSYVRSLAHEQVESFPAKSCQLCAKGIRYDTVDLDWGIEGPSTQRPVTLSAVQKHLNQIFGADRKFWSLARQVQAIQRHKIIGKVHVSPAIDVGRLLEVEASQEWLLSRLAEILIPLSEEGPWSLVSAPRKDPSYALADFAARQTGTLFIKPWDVVHSRHSRRFIEFNARRAGAAPPERALVLDAGACRGITLKGVFQSLRSWGVKELAACVIVDRTSPETRKSIESECGGRFFGIVKAPFKTFRTEEADHCPFCWKAAARLRAGRYQAHQLVLRYLAPQQFHWPKEEARKRDLPVKLQGQLFEDSSVSLEEFQSLVYAIALQEPVPGSDDENLLVHCIGQEKIGAPQRIKLINALTGNYLTRPRIQDSLVALARNNVAPTLLEAACVGLARAQRFDWLDWSWFSGHLPLLSRQAKNAKEPGWLFMAYVLGELYRYDRDAAARLKRTLTDSVRKSRIEQDAKRTIGELTEVLSPSTS